MTALRDVRRLIDDAAGRAMQLVRRGILRSASASGWVQAEGFAGEHFDGVELWQQYGLASRPPAGAEVLLAQVDGQAEQAIAFATSARASRPTDLEAGETRLYGPGTGQAVRMRADGSVDVVPASGVKVYIGGPTGAQAMLLGETVQANIITFANAVAAAADLAAVKLAAGTLATAAAGWLATKGEVA